MPIHTLLRMLTILTAPALAPFTVAFFLMIGLLVIEVVSMLAGKSASAILDGLFEGEMDGSLFDWINPAGVPLLIYLVLLAGTFSMAGYGVQAVAQQFSGMFSPLVASLITLPVAFPLSRWASRIVGRIVPQFESYALEQDSLMGQTAEITVGPVRADHVARVKLRDRQGNWHFPKVEPMNPADVIPEGATVVIVETSGSILKVVRADFSPPVLAGASEDGRVSS
ncbi:OB-fold-containig protein [Lacibacterium aquatile]|uniref:OB-fold-containig protein n=1 Tax=Lacibacterium aquatile TaxID=1168082 RepID=A0ABW5DM61_9PROT